MVEPGRKAWQGLKDTFGDAIFKPNGELDREALGDLIFNNPVNRRKLNEITHPEIYKEMFVSTVKCFFKGCSLL